MAIKSIDHANIRCADLGATVAFYRDVLGMAATVPPGLTSIEQGAWLLDDSGRAVIHLGPKNVPYPIDDDQPAASRPDTGNLHHVALSCSGFEALRASVVATGLTVRETSIESLGLRQLFVTEPNGVLLELNFWGD
jgi:catechol 2,3-dioxygenase-like lactoylglutathione lyase family enzyme